ncbi:MAG: hypothetical protein N5P05_003289 [Chroococcopsis gigantea SAG 12.99]|jgi:hypothetical protein|nr:DUF3011 domain-containing protein [Chlorogloea purpurea SAG 13.99]MDV3001683.1 hypothetical protein [Chroococcopsis gigantea SAG 12.99]
MNAKLLIGISGLIVLNTAIFSPASAQNNNNNNNRIICESRGSGSTRCAFDTRRGVQLVRQLSQATCEGNWTSGNGYIEVRNGCRGEFARDRGNNNNNNYASRACQSALLQRFNTVSDRDVEVNSNNSSSNNNNETVNWRIRRLGPSGTCTVNRNGEVRKIEID